LKSSILTLSIASLACAWPAVATSARAADPVTECIAANEHSLELRDQGKLLDARSQLALCAASTCPDAIQQACRGRIADLNAAIPSIVFEVKDGLGRDLSDVKLSIDGKPSGTAGVTALQLDPGQHTFRFEAAGQPPVEKAILLREGEGEKRADIVLGEVEPPAAKSGANSRKVLGLVVGGAGVAVMASAGVLALVAKSSYDGAAGCSGSQCTDTSGFDTSNSARNLGNIATAVLIGGGVLALTGGVLWLTAPNATPAASTQAAWDVGVTPGGAALRTRF
jgi:hypothetical protein